MNSAENILKRIKKVISNPTKIIIFLASRNIIKVKDETFLKLKYKDIFNKELDLVNPQTFNEKLQWLKLYNRKDMYTTMVDKYEAKKHVGNLIGEQYIIPTIGIFNKFEDIDFNKLPEQFVIKCTHDSESVIVCRNKDDLDSKNVKKKIQKCLKRNYYLLGREWAYKNVKPRIIIEKFMQDVNETVLKDYKFFCFNGNPEYLYISEGLENHKTARIDFFNMNFKPAPFARKDYKRFEIKPMQPYNFEKMKEFSKILSKDIPFIRVDFYEINKKIYFGELTFYPCDGYMPFEPMEYDKILGDMLELPKEKIRK